MSEVPSPQPPPATNTPPRRVWPTACVLLTTWLAATGWLSWLLIAFPEGRGEGPSREIPLEVGPDMTVEALAERLAAEGAIPGALHFKAYLCLQGGCERLRRGFISVNPALTVREQAVRVASMPAQRSSVRVLLPEGFTRFDVARRLQRHGVCDADAFMAATEDRSLLDDLGIEAPSAEGYLFPDTYEFDYPSDARRVVATMVRTFDKRLRPLLQSGRAGMTALVDQLGWQPHQFVTLASIVEKEAQRKSERAIIAGVFANRLLNPDFRPHRLQADPTIAYGCLVAPNSAPTCAQFDGKRVLPAMLRDRANPYNTYRHEGLPPGPICNPGLGALRAALSPERHRYLYFVASGGGAHTFSETLSEHNRAVRGQR